MSSGPLHAGPEIDMAVAALRAGAVVALPTDTVYGLAVDPRFGGATDLLFALKQRPATLELPVLVADSAQAEALAGSEGLSPVARRLVERFWPGSVTFVVERRPEVDWELGGDGRTIGLRCPAHALVRHLCRRVGPLATTSANRHGEAPITTVDGLNQAFGGSLGAVIDGGVCQGLPSTVIDLTAEVPRCLREGVVLWTDVERYAGPL